MNRHVKRHLDMERLFGADFIPRIKNQESRIKGNPGIKNQESRIKGETQRETQREAQRAAEYPREFLDFMKPVLECTKCGLHETRTQVVFGVGPLGAPLMFVGEGPGEDEDKQGEPFVGRAGRLLTKTLKRVGVERGRVYIANIVKCRPPGNRNPQPDEMSACIPWLFRQMRFVGPKIVCALGNVAMQTLLNTKTGITKMRGRMVEAHGVRIFPAYHPAYVLRNMGMLVQFETDVRKVCREAGLT